MQKYDIKTFQG
ncbi:hypothetical protein D050_4232A, partial [Vibrio parahaemolyticus VPCR-2009]